MKSLFRRWRHGAAVPALDPAAQADYLRQLGETEMADGDLDSISHCADDLESAIIMMFQLAGGTRLELRQRYQDLKVAMRAEMLSTIDLGRNQ